MKISIPDYLEQWYESVEYAKKTLCLAGVSPRVTLSKIFTTPKGKVWSDILFLIKLLFTIPVSNFKLGKIFSELKRVKSNCFLLRLWCHTFGDYFENHGAVGKILTHFHQ